MTANPADAVLEALLPCPFCGREPKYSSRADNHTDTKEAHFIACYCGGYAANAHQFADSRDGVIAKWNNRPSLAALAGAEAVAWVLVKDVRSCGLRRHMTQSQYDANPSLHKWYEPFRCANCETHAPAKAREDEAFAMGWRTAANWMERDDLIADIGSPAYIKDRDAAMATFAEG